jgi:hypothetical protein
MSSRPAAIKGSLQVNQGRPRRITEPEMVSRKEYLLELLEKEIKTPQL